MTGASTDRLWIQRLRLNDFRNYEFLSLDLDTRAIVLTGPNGAGKTNLLEAVSLLSPGRGLGRAVFAEMIRRGAPNGWAVNAHIHCVQGEVNVGTGYAGTDESATRIARIDGETVSGTSALGMYVRVIWLAPSMDGLFTGSPGERRRFLDRLVQSLDAGYRPSLSRFERAMRQRNRLLEMGETSAARYEGLEIQMAEAGIAIAAARLDAVTRLAALSGAEGREPSAHAFPWATLALEGLIEQRLQGEAAVEVEDAYRDILAGARGRDRAAKRTLDGPHRSDLVVGHGPKVTPARTCSTGEQKALLIGLILAHARLVKQRHGNFAPLILLDEIVAHLDEQRRESLFAEITALKAQAWMTGTEASHFAPLGSDAQFLSVEGGGICT